MKRTLVILLCLTVLSLSLFANGGSEEKSSSKITVSAPGVYPIVTEPFEMRLMVPQQLGNTPDWKTNAASMLMEEVTGVKVIYDVAPISIRQEPWPLLQEICPMPLWLELLLLLKL
jgi:hypothetical protein